MAMDLLLTSIFVEKRRYQDQVIEVFCRKYEKVNEEKRQAIIRHLRNLTFTRGHGRVH